MSGKEKIHVTHLSPSLVHWASAYIWGLLPISEDLIALDKLEHSTERNASVTQLAVPGGNLDQEEVAMIYREYLSTERQELDREMQLRGHRDAAGPLAQFTDG